MSNILPLVFTPNEIADYLKVDTRLILREFENRRLRGFKVGDEWRCTEADLIAYTGLDKRQFPSLQSELMSELKMEEVSKFAEVEGFDFHWPGGPEYFEKGYETTRRINGRNLNFRIGFCKREAAGQERLRVVVWLGNKPLVEFAGGNDFEKNGLIASVIKLRNGRQLRAGEEVPREYQIFQVARYDSVVQGPYASRNMAVVVHKDDFESMLWHAIIRASWKSLI